MESVAPAAPADVVVVGGGVIGTACAEALSREGMKVVVLERHGLAAGASSACQSGVGLGVAMDANQLAGLSCGGGMDVDEQVRLGRRQKVREHLAGAMHA